MTFFWRGAHSFGQNSPSGGFAIFAVLALFIAGAPALAQTKLPPERFVEAPTTGAPALSPSGRYLAVPRYDAPNEQALLLIVDLADIKAPKTAGFKLPKPNVVDSVRWKDDRRVIVSFTTLDDLSQSRWDSARKRSKDLDDELYGQYIIDADGKNGRSLSMESRLYIFSMLHLLPDDPDHVLVEGIMFPSALRNVYRLNVNTGKAEQVIGGTKYTQQWLVDTAGVPRARLERILDTKQIDVLVRKGESDEFSSVARYDLREYPKLKIIGFADDPRTAIVASRGDGDKYGLYELDLTTQRIGKALYQNPNVDVGWPAGGPIYDPATTKLIGVSYVRDVWFRYFLDPRFSAAQAAYEGAFTDASDIAPISWSKDAGRIVLRVSNPRIPAAYFLYDAATREVTSVGKAHDNLPGDALGEMLSFTYTTRDGAKIPGYITMPPGKPDKGLPMVVMPHGGPELRDAMVYDSWVQFLANRGYAVFQPNFRGSGGYGKTFLEAGYRQWGRRMQDDITDGVKALIADGTADASKICIVGASYGGYAALAGGAFTPDLYKCVVSIAGVSDIALMLKEEKFDRGSDSYAYEYWRRWVGDPATDLDEIKAWSPVNHAAKFKAPVMLVHGRDDTTVRVTHSTAMEEALRKAGKSVRFVRIQNEEHSFGPRGTLELLKALDEFLPQHIGN